MLPFSCFTVSLFQPFFLNGLILFFPACESTFFFSFFSFSSSFSNYVHLRVDEVPVDRVDLGVGERVNQILQRPHGLEVARAVHQHLAVGEARLVVNGPRRRPNVVPCRSAVEK